MEYRNIFISCSRDRGQPLGEALANTLRQRGYSVFIGTGLEEIASSTDFLLVLTPDCMCNVQSESDWIRMQIETAMREHKNIVPILADGFHFPGELPPSVESIRSCRSVLATEEKLAISTDVLCKNYLQSEPRKDHTKLFVILGILLAVLLALFLFRNQIISLIIPQATVSGVVTDSETGDPLSGVLITEGEKTGKTGEDGAYKMVVKPGEHTFVYTFEGYESAQKDYSLNRNDEAEGNLTLSDGKGHVTGTVTQKMDGAPIGGVTVTCGTESATTDANGAYSLYLEKGAQTLEVSSDEYETVEAQVEVIADDSISQDFELSTGTGVISGCVINAVDTSPLAGVCVTCGEQTVTTDQSGAYSLEVDEGSYTLTFTLDGFIEGTDQVTIQKDARETCDKALSPEMESDQYRVVLTWGENPRDLDSHLIWSQDHVLYSKKVSNVQEAQLDVDDTYSFGPETTTFTMLPGETYKFYVYKYAGSSTLALSDAEVAIYCGGGLVATRNVPSGDGDYWLVFTLKDGQITYGEEIQQDEPTLNN